MPYNDDNNELKATNKKGQLVGSHFCKGCYSRLACYLLRPTDTFPLSNCEQLWACIPIAMSAHITNASASAE